LHIVDEEPLIRIMALHALAYCERLFYLEEVEEIRVANEAVYEGREFHAKIPEYVELTSYHLESRKLGIQGKVDCIRSESGEWIPFEYKKGRSRKDKQGNVQAWDTDALQIAAYALLLEEHFDREIKEGRVYYAADHRTAVVVIDDVMRERVYQAIRRARELRTDIQRPPITENERLCAKCSLAPVCLPEEERFIARELDVESVYIKEPVPRYFPPDRDQETVHIVEPGQTLRRSAGMFILEDREGNRKTFPSENIGSFTIHGNNQITTQALHLAASKGIHLHWFSAGGKYVGSLTQAAGGTQRRLRQYKALTNQEMAERLSRAVVRSKVETQLRYILRQTRGADRTEFEEHIGTMRMALQQIQKQQFTREQLLGYEGIAARAYFECLKLLLKEQGEELAFSGRNKRPPRDPANAILSFLYSLLYRDCVQAVVTVGLDPTIGFYHQPRSTAYPLALDIMELFRVMLCDAVLIGTVGRKQWVLEEDFVVTGKQVWLTDQGKKKAITAYERRKQDTWKHPVIGYSLTYDRAIELEVRLLEKEWTGAPGLFAMNRIR